MEKRSLLQIRFEHIRNIDSWERAVIESMVRNNPKKFENFKGFIERKVFTTKDKIITEAEPMNVLSTDKFADLITKSGLRGTTF